MPAPFPNPFAKAFAPADATAEKIMGELWQLGGPMGQSYPAIHIETISEKSELRMGGILRDCNIALEVRNDVLLASGVVDGSILLVRGQRVRVREVRQGITDTKFLYCGPVGVAVPRP